MEEFREDWEPAVEALNEAAPWRRRDERHGGRRDDRPKLIEIEGFKEQEG